MTVRTVNIIHEHKNQIIYLGSNKKILKILFPLCTVINVVVNKGKKGISKDRKIGTEVVTLAKL